ncbi:hypothetical protein FRC05_001680 [Tulasnella sp. 425]|nr:hypothetical protein FRC05_001680 [Tulasnella sp. 425]
MVNKPQRHQANKIEPRGIDLANRETLLECQKGSKFAQLPEDILMLFSLQLDKTAKARVVQTCRYLRHLLEPTLYVHLGPFSSWKPDQGKPLHRTLAERPDLIQYIRSYKGPVIPPSVRSYTQPPPKRTLQNMFRVRKTMESINPPDPPIPETEGFRIAVFIFTRATQIVDLSLVDNMDWNSDPIFEPIKTAVSEMSLNRLYLWGCAKPIQVLQTQPELEHLELGWNVGSVEGLDKVDIPKLKSLTSMLEDASYIVPGRPVEQLILSTKGRLDTDLFSCLALSTGPILKLSMWAYDHWSIRNGLWFAQNGQRPLQIASQNLPNLEQLTIDVNGRIPIQLSNS